MLTNFLSSYQETSVQEIFDARLTDHGVRLLIKREDTNHMFVSGNKWWKLKYNLIEAESLGKKTLLTFGGAYSNHLYATAAAATIAGFNSIGIVRGEQVIPLNATLTFAREHNMELLHVSRDEYRKRNEHDYLLNLQRIYPHAYIIPEGGTNRNAVTGCVEFASKLRNVHADYVCCPVGTGGTLAGLVEGLPAKVTVLGFSSLKGEQTIVQDIKSIIANEGATWRLISDYHFGGYAKVTDQLLRFILDFEQRNAIRLEQVYTGKMLYGIFDLVEKSFFPPGSTILAIHTGGLQGRIASL